MCAIFVGERDVDKIHKIIIPVIIIPAKYSPEDNDCLAAIIIDNFAIELPK